MRMTAVVMVVMTALEMAGMLVVVLVVMTFVMIVGMPVVRSRRRGRAKRRAACMRADTLTDRVHACPPGNRA